MDATDDDLLAVLREGVRSFHVTPSAALAYLAGILNKDAEDGLER